jgi:hypothetical protein
VAVSPWADRVSTIGALRVLLNLTSGGRLELHVSEIKYSVVRCYAPGASRIAITVALETLKSLATAETDSPVTSRVRIVRR